MQGGREGEGADIEQLQRDEVSHGSRNARHAVGPHEIRAAGDQKLTKNNNSTVYQNQNLQKIIIVQCIKTITMSLLSLIY
jgi:hypothetical protein